MYFVYVSYSRNISVGITIKDRCKETIEIKNKLVGVTFIHLFIGHLVSSKSRDMER